MFDLNTDPAFIGPATARNLHFTPKRASVGLIQDLPYGLVASITGQYVVSGRRNRPSWFPRRA